MKNKVFNGFLLSQIKAQDGEFKEFFLCIESRIEITLIFGAILLIWVFCLDYKPKLCYISKLPIRNTIKYKFTATLNKLRVIKCKCQAITIKYSTLSHAW